MAKKPTSINLVKADKNQLTNQVVNWALTIGRVLIIVVEIIALSAFIYRFVLDNQLRDINSKIKLEQQILDSQKDKEDSYRNLQERLNLAASIVDQAQEKTKIYKDILSFTPQGLSFTNVSYLDNSFNMQLTTSSAFPLSVFVTSLKNYDQTNSISIDLIENHAITSTIDVGLTVTLKTKGGVNNENTGN